MRGPEQAFARGKAAQLVAVENGGGETVTTAQLL